MKELETTVIVFLFATLFSLAWCSKVDARNDYLNNSGQKCTYGSVDLSISKGDRDSNSNNSNPYWDKREENNNQITLSFRKDLGISKKTCDQQNRISLQNEKLKQQLELYKKCGSINRNSTLQYNNNFNELVFYCKGISGTDNNKPEESGSYWDKLKKDHKNLPENKNTIFMGDKILMPPKDYKLPIPE
tara:strand:+ start:352 stop:918 length:567 start_codon:yes stop_codon:yes gene_type:complete